MKDGKARITVPQNEELELTSDIASVLSFEAGKKYTPGNHHRQIVNFAQPRELYIYLNQISTVTNYVNGAPLLVFILVADKPFGKTVVCRFESPIFKKLINGCITELSLRITDETGTVLNNHGLPIIIELLVR